MRAHDVKQKPLAERASERARARGFLRVRAHRIMNMYWVFAEDMRVLFPSGVRACVNDRAPARAPKIKGCRPPSLCLPSSLCAPRRSVFLLFSQPANRTPSPFPYAARLYPRKHFISIALVRSARIFSPRSPRFYLPPTIFTGGPPPFFSLHFIRASVHYANVSSFPGLLSSSFLAFDSFSFLPPLPTERVIFCRRASRRNLSANVAIIAALPRENRPNTSNRRLCRVNGNKL